MTGDAARQGEHPSSPQGSAAIVIYTTGGSIDKTYSTATSDFVVDAPAVGRLLTEANVGCAYRIEPLFRKDSLEITDADRALLRRKIEADASPRIVITHGTDTMVETARALSGIAGKTIVLTGSMQPAVFRETDAALNLGLALAAAQRCPPGVYIAMSGQVFDATMCRKNREIDRFEATA